jgi:2-amino-4-hydroxy-6-hydroxymethyldihydropteridine diphosphokinase
MDSKRLPHIESPRTSDDLWASGTVVALALGSNMGDPARWVRDGLAAIARTPGVWLQACSSFVITAPVGPIAQPDFVNAAAVVRTTLAPRALLGAMQAIELQCGRDRSDRAQRWGPRTLDIDVLTWGTARVHEEGLTIPHPRMHERAFVLVPLASIAPGLVVPGDGGPKTVDELLRALVATQASERVRGGNVNA